MSPVLRSRIPVRSSAPRRAYRKKESSVSGQHYSKSRCTDARETCHSVSNQIGQKFRTTTLSSMSLPEISVVCYGDSSVSHEIYLQVRMSKTHDGKNGSYD